MKSPALLALAILLPANLHAEKKPAPAKEVLRVALPSTPLLFQGDFFQRSLLKTSTFAPVPLAAERPATAKKEPAYKGQPLYGFLALGNTADNKVLVVVDDEAGSVWIDANQNGDLTDDPPVAWSWQSKGKPKEGEKRRFDGHWSVDAAFDLGGKRKSRATLSVAAMYEPGSGRMGVRVTNVRSGRMAIQGKAFDVMLTSHSANGEFFSDPEQAAAKKGGLGALFVDLTGDGTFAPMGIRKAFEMGKPVQFFGQWVQFETNADGSLVVARAAVAPPEAAFKPLPPKKAGDAVTDFEMLLPSGAKAKLSDYRGKFVVLDLWATWCGPCLAAMPKMEAHWKALKHNASLAFLGVCVGDEKAAFDKWIKEKGPDYSFAIGYDPAGRQKLGKDVMYLYGVGAIPTTFVVDPEGKILAVYTGLTPENEKALLKLLADKGIQEK